MVDEQVILKRNGACAVIKRLGGEMVSYQDVQGRERLHDGDPAVWAGFGPILFPTIGFSKNNQVRINSTTYNMPKHGLVRTSMFSIQNQSEDSVDMVFAANEQTLKHYPFLFELRVTYVLVDDGFSVNLSVKNLSDTVMPFMLGGHPAFKCPMHDNERFEDYEILFSNVETGTCASVNEQGLINQTQIFEPLCGRKSWTPDRVELAKMDTLVLTEPKSNTVRLVNKKTGKGLSFTFMGFPVLAIWTKPNINGAYLCLEPWHGLPSWENEDCEMKDRPYAIVLNANGKYQLTFTAAFDD